MAYYILQNLDGQTVMLLVLYHTTVCIMYFSSRIYQNVNVDVTYVQWKVF